MPTKSPLCLYEDTWVSNMQVSGFKSLSIMDLFDLTIRKWTTPQFTIYKLTDFVKHYMIQSIVWLNLLVPYNFGYAIENLAKNSKTIEVDCRPTLTTLI